CPSGHSTCSHHDLRNQPYQLDRCSIFDRSSASLPAHASFEPLGICSFDLVLAEGSSTSSEFKRRLSGSGSNNASARHTIAVLLIERTWQSGSSAFHEGALHCLCLP